MSKYRNSLLDFESSLRNYFPDLLNYKQWVVTNLKFTKNVLWNILMCYCVQSPTSERREFINSLFNSFESEFTIQNLKFWNPFTGKSKFRAKECVKELLLHFEKEIRAQYKKSQNKFHSKHEQYISLQASSILLNINILLIIKQKDEFGKDKLQIKLFPDFPEVVQDSHKRCLVLVDEIIETSETFSFCLTQEDGFRYRKSILKSVLSSNLGIDKRICKKICSFDAEEKVLFNILKYAEFEKVLHNFPNFVKKLQLAEFKVDPLHIFEQILKLPKCLEMIDKYMFLVYNVMLDRSNRLWLRNTYCFPDALLLKQFKNFQYTLNPTEKSQLTSPKNLLDDVKMYNEFLVNVCSELGKINRKRESNSINCSINLFYEARLREDMIKSILRVYLEHPSIKTLIEGKVSTLDSEYIKNIHLNITVMYFDELFSLVEDIDIPHKKLDKLINLASELYNVCSGEGSRKSISEYYESYLKSNESSYKIKEEKYHDIFVKIRDRDILLKKYIPKIYEQLLLSQLHYYLSIFLTMMNPNKSPGKLVEIKYFLVVDRYLQIANKFLMEASDKLKTIIIKKYVIDPICMLLHQQNTYFSIKTTKLKRVYFQNIEKIAKVLEEFQKIFAGRTFERPQVAAFPLDINKKFPKSDFDCKTNLLAQNVCKVKIVQGSEKSSATEDYENNIGSRKEKFGTIEYLKEQIKQLKMVLIDTDESIKKQWENENDPKNDLCLRYRITQLYLNEPMIQASAEMLLYYCMDILKTDVLVNVWCRTASVFNTTNIRNTLMKNMNCLICPLDVFSSSMDFIKKCTELIADRKIINSILMILKETSVDYHGFMDIIEDEYDDKYEKLRKEIISCDRWKEYALLIPWNDSFTEQSTLDSMS